MTLNAEDISSPFWANTRDTVFLLASDDKPAKRTRVTPEWIRPKRKTSSPKSLSEVIIITDGIIEGSMSAGDFGVLFGIFFGIVGIAIELGSYWLNLQTKLAPARRIFFIDFESDDDHTSGPDLRTVTEGVDLEHVDFVYPDGRKALSDVSLSMRAGEIIAVVGPSGAAKTSLARLLPGFLKPSRGRVLFDGRDIASLNIDSVRAHVAYVFQEHLLLAERIRENLLMAHGDASEEEMLRALDLAGCMPFVDEMPDGIDTLLGRSGNTLSMGQQQRLSIARRCPPCLPGVQAVVPSAQQHAPRRRAAVLLAEQPLGLPRVDIGGLEVLPRLEGQRRDLVHILVIHFEETEHVETLTGAWRILGGTHGGFEHTASLR